MMTTNDLKDLPESCPGCGKPLAEWTENDGLGVRSVRPGPRLSEPSTSEEARRIWWVLFAVSPSQLGVTAP